MGWYVEDSEGSMFVWAKLPGNYTNSLAFVLELIEKAGIKAYTCDELPVIQAIEMLQKNELSEINIAGNAHHGMN